MPKYVYRFIGDVEEHFSFLPADPPSRWLQPGDTVTCSEPVEHARLQLLKNPKPNKEARPTDDATS
jgi:hypothetical protein